MTNGQIILFILSMGVFVPTLLVCFDPAEKDDTDLSEGCCLVLILNVIAVAYIVYFIMTWLSL